MQFVCGVANDTCVIFGERQVLLHNTESKSNGKRKVMNEHGFRGASLINPYQNQWSFIGTQIAKWLVVEVELGVDSAQADWSVENFKYLMSRADRIIATI